MSDWELLLQILKETLVEWPRELIWMVQVYVQVRVYEWLDILPKHEDSVIKCTINKSEIVTTYVEESDHPNWGFFEVRSQFALGAGPHRWKIDVTFGRAGIHNRLGIGLSRLNEALVGFWLYPKRNALEIGSGCVRMQFFHYQRKKYRIYVTIDKENEIARFEFGDESSPSIQSLGTISLSTFSLDELYPTVAMVTSGNGCSITLVDE